MPTFMQRTRFATLVAVALVVLLSGVVVGAAGDPLILGQNNFAGSNATRLSTTSSGGAFWMTQNGSGSGVRGESINGTGGVFETRHANRQGLQAENIATTGGSGAALRAIGNENVGINATSADQDAIIAQAQGCDGLFCGRDGVDAQGVGFGAGVRGSGGVIGVFGDNDIGFGVWGSSTNIAVYSEGNAEVVGDLTVSGTCTGCTAATLAVNDGDSALNQGDAVTITGATVDASGNLLLRVAPAIDGDSVIGIVDTAMEIQTVEVGEDASIATYKSTSELSVAPGATLRVITGGLVAFASADASGGAISAGDSLAAAGSAGSLAKAGPETARGTSIGFALGSIEDGRVAVYVAPH